MGARVESEPLLNLFAPGHITKVLLTWLYMAIYIPAMRATHLYLKGTQIRQLKSLAKRTGAPVAELIRRAIDEFIRRQSAERREHGNDESGENGKA